MVYVFYQIEKPVRCTDRLKYSETFIHHCWRDSM